MADLTQLCDTVLSQRRLFIASNRGPVEHYMTADGHPEARRGSGGVVTAFSSITQAAEFTWVASAMGEGDRFVSNNGQGPSFKSPLPGHKIDLRYVVTPRRVYHKFYNVLCNPLLWFLQHYMWNPPYNPNVDANVHDAWETGYIPVNQAFAQAIVDECRDDPQPPIIFSHDYHLYLLPEFVRQELPGAIIQHFIHIPWPSPRFWQMIPAYIVQRICSSLCSADVVGFQTPMDCRSFIDTVEEFLPEASVDRKECTVAWRDGRTQVKSYPLSINVAEVQGIANSPRALEYETRLAAQTNEMNIVRIDRAEPNKNIVRGFKAFGLMLSKYPELRGRVNFLAFLVPSRTHIRQYQRYMDDIQQTINQVNQTHGNDEWKPIQTFIENNYTQALAGMKLYDALLVNTIIEGMNLVAKEGPVINTRDGVLVISQTSGVHHQLASGALSVSPTDIEGTMEALYQAITMPQEKRKKMASALAESVCREDITHWISRQLEDIAKLL
ncbi:MAG: hypothetical protein BZY80_06790 [SAR202 cluster bacterium Io17-Chloro-G2]|nr:MAG: hypothetical protein BZY80_06790 [SAR202 cluster bacterium Io17-Chloro-G2]